MSIYALSSAELLTGYSAKAGQLSAAYNSAGLFNFVPDLPAPTGNLTAQSTIHLPDVSETGKGFTCTGLAYSAPLNCYIAGDIGILLPNSGTIKSRLHFITPDFKNIFKTIKLWELFPAMSDVQGVTVDTTNNSIWFCSPAEKKIRNIDIDGILKSELTFSAEPTGIAYDPADDTLWALFYDNTIKHVNKSGIIISSDAFAFQETVDQCFIDSKYHTLYITAGSNYSTRNNVYTYNTVSKQQGIACTVDSYAVEGIWVNDRQMIILNDGLYHSATVGANVANIYDLE